MDRLRNVIYRQKKSGDIYTGMQAVIGCMWIDTIAQISAGLIHSPQIYTPLLQVEGSRRRLTFQFLLLRK